MIITRIAIQYWSERESKGCLFSLYYQETSFTWMHQTIHPPSGLFLSRAIVLHSSETLLIYENSFNMIGHEILKLLSKDINTLWLNLNVPESAQIKEAFEKYQIPFEFVARKEGGRKIEIFEMGYPPLCKFMDVYILALYLRNYGLQQLQPFRDTNLKISIGIYSHLSKIESPILLARPIHIEKFLSIDPRIDYPTIRKANYEYYKNPYEVMDEFDFIAIKTEAAEQQNLNNISATQYSDYNDYRTEMGLD